MPLAMIEGRQSQPGHPTIRGTRDMVTAGMALPDRERLRYVSGW